MKLEELIAKYQLPVDVVHFCLSNGLLDLGALQFHEAAYGTFTDLPGGNAVIEHRLLDLLTAERVLTVQQKDNGDQADHVGPEEVSERKDPPTRHEMPDRERPYPSDPGLDQLVILFGLSVRGFNVCENAGLNTLSKIRAFALEHGDFKKLRNCGAITQMELMDLLDRAMEADYSRDSPAQPDGGKDHGRMEAICTAQYQKLSIHARKVLEDNAGGRAGEAIIRFFMKQGRTMPKLPGARGSVMRELRAMREGTMNALNDRSVDRSEDSDTRSALLRWAQRHRVDPDLLPHLQRPDDRLSLLRFLERFLTAKWSGSRLSAYSTQLVGERSMKTLGSIADTLGLTRERIRQLMAKMDRDITAGLAMLSDLPGVREQYPGLVCDDHWLVVDDRLVATLNAQEGTTCSPLLIAYIAKVLNGHRLQLVKWAVFFDRTTATKELDHSHPLLIEAGWLESLPSTVRRVAQVIEGRRDKPERVPLSEFMVSGEAAEYKEAIPFLSRILPLRYPEIRIEEGYICFPANARRTRVYRSIPDPPPFAPGSLMRSSVLERFKGQHRDALVEFLKSQCKASKPRIERVIDKAIADGRLFINDHGVIQGAAPSGSDTEHWHDELPFVW